MEATSTAPGCPSCGRSMTGTAMVLARREEDGRRVCRGVWQCSDRHLWWRWSDRPDEPWEVCPHPERFGA
ncbi:dehydrogenase [Streptacidiphilus sp. ASG 303]|uniref:dehydrogenase n=1 Tax=Streptacidiphilus sp. ASG 303 TaxID=2896847 RepID=UPI001E2E00C4|nr:dehydrogenase [Streptacidiphilus sp. ASG 303]MCD0482600.1 dehydrogenase [Streptacidiphilus sp. ASG 303]